MYYGHNQQTFTCLSIVALCTSALNIRGTRHGSAEADPATTVVQPGHLLTRGSFEVIINTSGFIQPVEVVDVGAQVSGQLMRIDVKLGERVEQGQFVAEIDDRLIQARIAQAEAAIENLRAQINAKKAQLGYARAHQLRTDTLVERNIASRAQAELVQTTTAVAAAEMRALEAQLTGQEAALAGLRVDLGHTRIIAPVDGVITALLAQRGRTLNANQQAPLILRISRDRPLIAVARVPETQIERVRPGMQVRLTTVGGSSQSFEGILASVMRAPTIINEAVFYDAMVELGGEQHALPFGRTIQAAIVTDRLDCAVFLPRRSLPENANAGTLITASFRKQTGGVVTRVLRLRAVNEANGVVPCDEIDEAGINTTDRVMERLM